MNSQRRRWSKTEVLTDENGRRVGELGKVIHTASNGVVYHGFDGHILDDQGRRVDSQFFDSKAKAKRWVEHRTRKL